MLYLLIIIAFTVFVLLIRLIIPHILLVAFRKRLFDIPDSRKIHQGPIPRLKSLSFVLAIFFSLAFTISIPSTLYTMVFITKAITLIDSIDGLAFGLSRISLVALGTLFLSHQLWIYATLAFPTLGVLLPFFYYNVFGKAEHCKKIFIGDTGSLTLGHIFLSIRYCVYNPGLPPFVDGSIAVAFATLLIPMFDVILVHLRAKYNLFSSDRHISTLNAGSWDFPPGRHVFYAASSLCVQRYE